MLKKISVILAASLLITACSSSKKAEKIEAMQKKDKTLSCKDLLLEMNEADFYRKAAHKNRGVKLKNVLMPLGYISTYMDSEEAIEAAEARVAYLDKIFEIMHCPQKEEQEEKALKEAPVSNNQPAQQQPAAAVVTAPAQAAAAPVQQAPQIITVQPQASAVQAVPEETIVPYDYSGTKYYPVQ